MIGTAIIPSVKGRHSIAALLGLLLITAIATAVEHDPATEAEPIAPPATLHLAGGDVVAGHLLASETPTAITWKAYAFTAPLSFPIGNVQAIQFPRQEKPASTGGSWCFELSGGDVIFGSLAALDDREAAIDVPGLGRVSLERTGLYRFHRASPDDLIFAGPEGLNGWEISPAKTWLAAGSQLQAKQPGATLHRSFSLPPLVRYELELSWTAAPQFELAVGIDKHQATVRPAFSLETWADELVVVRETDRRADLRVMQKLAPGPGRLQLQLLFDQPQGRLLIFSAQGEKLGELHVPNEKTSLPPPPTIDRPVRMRVPRPTTSPGGGLRLINRRGNLTLQRLAISRWSGAAPQAPEPGKALIRQTDGKSRSAEIQSYDADARQIVLRDDGGEQRLAETLLDDVVLSQPVEQSPRPVRVLLTSGCRLSGNLLKIESHQLTLECAAMREPLLIPLVELHSLVVSRQNVAASTASSPPGPAREGRLELANTSLRGYLVNFYQAGSASLAFRPVHAESPSPLADSVSGRLAYREPQPAKPPHQPSAVDPLQARIINGIRKIAGKRSIPLAPRPVPPGECLLHLRTGDTVPCRVHAIDVQGVRLTSNVTAAEYVLHAHIKALELRLDIPPARIEKTKADRLLTLPRMQRDNPPEHLIRSLEGDYLRGRLLAMDEKELQLEVRLETKTLERAQIARIIWLHASELVNSTSEPATGEPVRPPQPAGRIRVQAVPRDGRRLTFVARKLEGQTLVGQSTVLGDCHVDLSQIDQLLIGQAIDEVATNLAFHQWKLRPAPEPLPTPDEGAQPGGSEGLESVLVGKPAPAVELDLLDGKKFRLADQQNKVAVLDFWASWCGPCLQSMPQVDSVVREFASDEVLLVAVNLQETPERVRAALERLKLETLVALDQDGRVAERYGATTIPQTVIIDRSGNVARVFIGGGARFGDQLRQALKSIVDRPATSAND